MSASDASEVRVRSTTRLLAGPVRHSVRPQPLRVSVPTVVLAPSLSYSMSLETPRAASEEKGLFGSAASARRRRASLTHAAVQQVFGRGPAVLLRDARSQRDVARSIGSRAVPLVRPDDTPSPSHALISDLIGQRRRDERTARKAARAALGGLGSESKESKAEPAHATAAATEVKRESKDAKDVSALSHAAVAAAHGTKRRSFAPASPTGGELRSHADIAAALGTRHRAAKRSRERSLSPAPSSSAAASSSAAPVTPRLSHAEIARAFGRRASLGGASSSSSSFVRLSHSEIARAFGTRHRRASRASGSDSSSAVSGSDLSDASGADFDSGTEESDASDSARTSKRARTEPADVPAVAQPVVAAE